MQNPGYNVIPETKPIYIKASQFPPNFVQKYDLCVAAEKTAGEGSIFALHKYQGVFRLHTNTEAQRTKLLGIGFRYQGLRVLPVPVNPNSAIYINGKEVPTSKLTISNIPLSVCDKDILFAVEEAGYELITGNVSLECLRDQGGKLSRFRNGNRSVTIKTPNQILPKQVKVQEKFTGFLYYKDREEVEQKKNTPDDNTKDTDSIDPDSEIESVWDYTAKKQKEKDKTIPNLDNSDSESLFLTQSRFANPRASSSQSYLNDLLSEGIDFSTPILSPNKEASESHSAPVHSTQNTQAVGVSPTNSAPDKSTENSVEIGVSPNPPIPSQLSQNSDVAGVPPTNSASTQLTQNTNSDPAQLSTVVQSTQKTEDSQAGNTLQPPQNQTNKLNNIDKASQKATPEDSSSSKNIRKSRSRAKSRSPRSRNQSASLSKFLVAARQGDIRGSSPSRPGGTKRVAAAAPAENTASPSKRQTAPPAPS